MILKVLMSYFILFFFHFYRADTIADTTKRYDT